MPWTSDATITKPCLSLQGAPSQLIIQHIYQPPPPRMPGTVLCWVYSGEQNRMLPALMGLRVQWHIFKSDAKKKRFNNELFVMSAIERNKDTTKNMWWVSGSNIQTRSAMYWERDVCKGLSEHERHVLVHPDCRPRLSLWRCELRSPGALEGQKPVRVCYRSIFSEHKPLGT